MMEKILLAKKCYFHYDMQKNVQYSYCEMLKICFGGLSFPLCN
jgi:hypothetical protein